MSHLGLCFSKAVLETLTEGLAVAVEENCSGQGQKPHKSPGDQAMGSLFEMGQLPVQFDGHQHVLQNVDRGTKCKVWE